MKAQLITLILLSLYSSLFCQESTESIKEPSFKEKYKIENVVAPLVSSDPNFGNAVGFTTFTLFDLKEDVPTSTISFLGLYSNRDSHFLGAFGKIAPSKDWTHKFAIADISVKSQLELSEYPERVDYTTDILPVVFEPTYKFKNNLLAGLQLKYIDLSYSPDNAAGEEFLEAVDAEDVTSLSLGFTFGYDSRDNPFFPSIGSHSRLVLNYNGEALGHTTDSLCSKRILELL